MNAPVKLTPTDMMAAEMELCRRSFARFHAMSWHVLEPGQPYAHGWHMDAMAEHLEAVVDGQIRRLLINVPPGTSKSTICGVSLPAWVWGAAKKPHFRMISASHDYKLAGRDNLKSRRLIESDWYQSRWPIKLTSDQNEKSYFENEKTGFRQANAVESMTGRRGDLVLWDDPHSPESAYSDVKREKTIRIFSETLPTRLNNPDRSAIVVVMQRLHENDVSGHILSKDLGYEHLMLPMEFEPDRKCYTSIGFEDPRMKEGELLFPDRFPQDVVERDKKIMGSFAIAGQFQQRPVPRGGGMFSRSWFEVVPAAPAGTRWVRGWDFAASSDESAARTAGVKLGRTPDGRFIVGHVAKGHLTPANVERLVTNTATQDGYDVKGSIPQDPGQAGKSQVQYFIKKLAGYNYKSSPESGDKITRAQPFAAQAEAGNVLLLQGDWVEDYLDEVCSFPFGKYADQVDATTRAFSALLEESHYSLESML